MLHRIGRLVETRSAWFLLLLSTLGLLAAALYFQFALGLEPCVKCVYQRVAMLGIAAATILPLLAIRFALARLLGLLGWFIAAGWGFLIAREHNNLQNSENAFFAVCETFPNFPGWAPLHEWLPEFFAAPGLCGDIDWSFLGLSMPGWLQYIFAAYALVALAFILLRLVRFHRF